MVMTEVRATESEEVRRLRRQIRYRDAQLLKLRKELKQLKSVTDISKLAELVKALEEVTKLAPSSSAQVRAWEEKWQHAWAEMGKAATQRGLCSEYDDVVRRIGGIPRPARRRY